MSKVDQSVVLAGVRMKNPVVVASGTFGFGREYGRFYDLSELGGICCKGLTLCRREGNPPPRIAETPMGILNSVGLQNPGVDAFIAEELPELRKHDLAVIANISGNTPEEYGVMCEKLSAAGVDMIEVNISCPNVKAGGLAYGTKPELAAEVTAVAKAHAGRVPVMVKLSPNVTDVTEIARAVADAGADACPSSTPCGGCASDVNTRRPILKMNTGACPVPPCCLWRCGWCGRLPMPCPCPFWAWAAWPAGRMRLSSCWPGPPLWRWAPPALLTPMPPSVCGTAWRISPPGRGCLLYPRSLGESSPGKGKNLT